MNQMLNNHNNNNQNHHNNYGSVNSISKIKNGYHMSHQRKSLLLQHNTTKVQNTPKKSPYFRPYSPALTCKSALASPPSTSISTDKNLPHNHQNQDENENKITVWQAGFTIINLFLGLCLLSYPYALACGSFISLILFIFISFALCYTGKLIVRCFNYLSQDIEQSYPMLGYYSFNNFGYLLISIGICAELFGALCTNTIFLWTNLSYLLTPFGLGLHEIIIICVLLSLPTCWMLNFNQLSINSFLGCICKVFTAIVVVITFFLNLDTVHDNIQSSEIKMFPNSIQSFCISLGIYIMSFSGHPCLPSIYRQMKHPQKFEKMLDYCFVIMCASYILISVFGYLTFGEHTNVIITGNLLHQNVYLSKTLIILVVAGCYFQVSPLIAVMAEIPENNIFKIESKFKIRLFRTLLFLFICIASYICMDKLQFLEAITGSICTMIVSVICPALFYYKLFLSNKKNIISKKKIILPATSPIFIPNGLNHKMYVDENVNDMDLKDEQNKLGLRIILYLYVIIGTVIGGYMFGTDLINALSQ